MCQASGLQDPINLQIPLLLVTDLIRSGADVPNLLIKLVALVDLSTGAVTLEGLQGQVMLDPHARAVISRRVWGQPSEVRDAPWQSGAIQHMSSS